MKSPFKWAHRIICLRNLSIKNVSGIIALIASCAHVAVFPKFDLKTFFFNWAGLTETTCDGGPVSLPLLVVVARLVDLQQAPDPLHLWEQESATSSDRVDLEKAN